MVIFSKHSIFLKNLGDLLKLNYLLFFKNNKKISIKFLIHIQYKNYGEI